MMNKLVRRVVAAMVLMGFVTMNTACYGPFALTKNVYHWNGTIKGSGQVNDKWMKELVFFGMLVAPAYMFSALLDTFIFNAMHFWTGESPIKSSESDGDGQTKTASVGGTTIRWTSSGDGATVVYERHGIVQRHARIVTSPTGYRLIDDQGRILSEAVYLDDGNVRLLNGEGHLVQQWNETQLQLMVPGIRTMPDRVGG
jgi:hypothetical protein